MAGEVAELSDGMGMMKSSTRSVSSVACMITDVCSRTVSGNVFDTLNYVRNYDC